MANPYLDGIAAGPRTDEQWCGYFKGRDVSRDAADEAFVNGLDPPATTAIPHYVDPADLSQGRPVPTE